MLKKVLDFFGVSALIEDYGVQSPWNDPQTPDHFITAAVIRKMTDDFENWSCISKPEFDYPAESALWKAKTRGLTGVNIAVYNGDLVFAYKKERVFRRDAFYEDRKNFHVNGLPIPEFLGKRIHAAYDALVVAHEKLKAEAARVKREMEENEKKWDLAEELLGMRRTKSGALVPADMLCECGEAKGHCPCVNERTKVDDCCDLAGRPHLVCEFFPN